MSDDPKSYPALGRLLLWVDKPGSANKVFWAVLAICAGLFLYNLTIEKHGHFDMENLAGFYGVFGFIAFTAVILGAKGLRVLIQRSEDFYGNKAIDSEDYPASGLEKVDHDG